MWVLWCCRVSALGSKIDIFAFVVSLLDQREDAQIGIVYFAFSRWDFSMSVAVEIGTGVLGTLVLWVMSGAMAMTLGLLMCVGSLSPYAGVRLACRAGVNITRGVPTSLLVIAAGMGMLRLPDIPTLPTVFPGTPSAFQHVAWGVMLALALGSAGHLAEIFYAAYAALGRARLEQATVLGLPRFAQLLVLAHEAAAIVTPPTAARLVHHLHNTAFAALFPIAELFGAVQGLANASFRVFQLTVIGALIYIALSSCAWLLARMVEATLGPSVTTYIVEGAPTDDRESAIRFAR